jgi:hypothetical protein
MIREMSRFLSYGSIAVELNPVRQKAQLMRPRESGGASPRCRLGLITPGACMPIRCKLFEAMHRNALAATEFFRIPPNRVIELGGQVEI